MKEFQKLKLYLQKIDKEKLKAWAIKNRRIIILVIILLFVLITQLTDKQAYEKNIVYKNDDKHDFSSGRVISNGSNIYQKKDRMLLDRMEKLESKIEMLTETLSKQAEQKPAQLGEVQPEASKDPVELQQITDHGAEYAKTAPPPPPTKVVYPPQEQNIVYGNNGETPQKVLPPAIDKNGPTIISFPVKNKNNKEFTSVSLPSGSYVKAKLLTGVEAPEGKTLPVLLQADFAFIGPNRTKVDLSGCFLIAKSTGNLSTERVEMQASKLSCVAKSGRSFERDINGFVADDKDNSFAVIGEVNSKQDRVAAMAFLSSVVQGISGAIGQMQMTTSMGASGVATQMLTGDESKYIAAGGATNAASTVTQWYLKHAQGLFPTINIGSGQDIWIVMQDSVDLPNWYFKKQDDHRGGVSFLSNLLEQQ